MTPETANRARVTNGLLRRADGRFLLPCPAPRKTVCFAVGGLAEATALISDKIAGPSSRGAADCDLAVAVDPDVDCLRAAWAALRPGGTLLAEWRAGLPGKIGCLRRTIESAGYADVVVYRTWPSIASAQFWAPLKSVPVLAYLRKNRPRPKTLVRRLADALRWLCWRKGIWPGPPLCTVARKSAPAAQRSDLPNALSELLLSRWRDWHLGAPPQALSWLLLTGGSRTISKVVALVFDHRGDAPQIVLKFPRLDESAHMLANEAFTLRALEARAVQGVPRLLFTHEYGGRLMLGETAMAGKPIYCFLDRRSYRDLASKATDWCIDFAGRPDPVPRHRWWDRSVLPILEAFERSFGPVVDCGMLRDTEAALSTIRELPIVCEQRDFAPWNVFLGPDGSVVVLDWESADLEGLPALDLIYFLTYHAFEFDGAPRGRTHRESYRASLDPSTITGRVRHECLARYVGATGMDPAAIPPLRLLVWLLHSRSEYQRLCADAGGTPDPAALRASLFLSLWQEELRSVCGPRGAH